MTVTLFNCILDVWSAAVPVIPSDHSENDTYTTAVTLREEDPMQIGISNIVKIVEDIDEITDSQLTDGFSNDHTILLTDSRLLRKIRTVEYQPFECAIQCFVRPPWYSQEAQRLLRLTSLRGDVQSFVLDCFNKTQSITSSGLHPVSLDCVSHYTGRLVHVILELEKSVKSKLSDDTVIIPSEQMATTLTSLVRENETLNDNSATGLYITFNVPLSEVILADLKPMEPWLRYVAIDGQSLRSIDKLLLANLSLDYFVIEGCRRTEERMHPINEQTQLLTSASCAVVWKFECQNATGFELWADNKTQTRLCGQTLPLTSFVNKPPALLTRIRSRARRSTHDRRANLGDRRISTFDIANSVDHQQWSVLIEKLIERIDKGGLSIDSSARQDVIWYQNALNIALAIGAFLAVLLCIISIALGLLFRQLFRVKIKPV